MLNNPVFSQHDSVTNSILNSYMITNSEIKFHDEQPSTSLQSP